MKKFKSSIVNFFAKPTIASITSSIICILIGLTVGFFILLATVPEEAPIGIASIMFFQFKPEFFNQYFVGSIVQCVPIVLSGLSVLFAFKTGLFNIGAPGQMIIGAFVGVAISLTSPIQNQFTLILAMIGGILAGAVWGFLVGFLKAHFHVHEVISSIMLNYIATYLVAMLIKNPIFYYSSHAMTKNIPTYAQIPTWGLDELFPGSNLDISIFIVIIIAIIVYLVLNKTTLGFQLKATGLNKDAAQNASIKYKSNVMISMAISGALAGLGGMILYCSSYSKGIEPKIELLIQGFDGISVALLASLNPIGAIFCGFFIQYIRNGGLILRVYTRYATEIGDIIIAVIIYCSAFVVMIKGWLIRNKNKYKDNIDDSIRLKPKEDDPPLDIKNPDNIVKIEKPKDIRKYKHKLKEDKSI